MDTWQLYAAYRSLVFYFPSVLPYHLHFPARRVLAFVQQYALAVFYWYHTRRPHRQKAYLEIVSRGWYFRRYFIFTGIQSGSFFQCTGWNIHGRRFGRGYRG